MSTSLSPGLAELYREVAPYLNLLDFETVVVEAKKYHEGHPLEEFTIDTSLGNPKHQHFLVEGHQLTLDKLASEHHEAVMMLFLRKDIPYSLAKRIVDQIILES